MSRFARARQLLAVVFLLVGCGVLAVYLGRRHAAARHPAPKISPLGLKVSRTEGGITISRNDGDRPVFRLYADRAEQLRADGHEELYNVRIDAYDADGVHADQISGRKLGFNQTTNEVTADDTVQIDLQGRPPLGVDDATATAAVNEAGEPVHIEAHDLVYNVKTGLGTVDRGVTFTYRDAHGGARQARFASHTGVVELEGDVILDWPRPPQPEARVMAGYARLDRNLGLVALDRGVRLAAGTQALDAQRMLVTLRHDYGLRRVEAWGDVHAHDSAPARTLDARSAHAWAEFNGLPAPARQLAVAATATAPPPASRSEIRHLRLDGGVVLLAPQASPAGPRGRSDGPSGNDTLTAGSTDFTFGPGNQLTLLAAQQAARLSLTGAHPSTIAASELDFHFTPHPSSPGQSAVQLATVDAQGRTLVDLSGGVGAAAGTTAHGAAKAPVHAESDNFHFTFDAQQQPVQASASGHVLLRQPAADGALQTSSSDTLWLDFAPKSAAGAEAAVTRGTQTGSVTVHLGDRTLTADRLVYTAASRQITLTALPASSFTHGQVQSLDPAMRLRAPKLTVTETDSALPDEQLSATGGVALSFFAASTALLNGPAAAPSPAPANPFLDAATPTTVTAETLRATQPAEASASAPVGSARFTGNVRLVHGSNMLQADAVNLDRASATLTAEGHVVSHLVAPAGMNPVAAATTSANAAQAHATQPVTIAADQFSYTNGTLLAQYQGHVLLSTSDATMAADHLDVYLAAAPAVKPGTTASPMGLDRAVANGNVAVDEPSQSRRGLADHLVYQAATRVVRLSGNPRIFVAEQATVTGDVLTFSLADDAITIESNSGKPTVVQRIIH